MDPPHRDDAAEHDHSDEDRPVLPALREFKSKTPGTRIIRFHRRMQYAHGLAFALSMSRGDHVLFLSQDMLLPSDCVRELISVIEADPLVVRLPAGGMTGRTGPGSCTIPAGRGRRPQPVGLVASRPLHTSRSIG